jgi:hypothetical protein
MSSLLNNASLLLNPAGSVISYKEDKIYSVIPRNGAGDFTFTGGDGGTRVNQQGYVEVTPANLNTNSEKFGPGFWNNFGGTITDNSVVAPNGTTTGTTFNGSPAGTYKTFNGIVPGQVYTVSMYVKLGTATNCVIIINNSQAWNTVGGKSFTSADGLNTTDWTRVSFTFTGPAFGAINWHIGYHFESGVTQQTNGTYFVWGAMLNIGSTALPYQPTTDRLNYPRITYQNGRGALLSEPQRTNVLTNSQNFNLTPHTLQNATITTGSGISPDGTNNANKLISSGGTNTFYRWYDNLGALGGTYTYSIFAKADSGSMQYVCIGVNTNASNGPNNVVEYNIANGTISRNPYGVTAYIEPYKDGWYRLVHTYNLGTAGSFVHPCIAISNGTATLSTFQNLWDSTAGQYVYLWGSQYEAGAFPTSYIPTTSATVTRPRDTTENSSASSVIGQTEGVLYTDFNWDILKGAVDFLVLTISNGTTANNVFLDIFNDTVVFGVDNSSSRVVQIQSSTITTGRHKMAGGYKNNDFVLYLDGKQIGTDTVGAVPACSVVDVGLWANGSFPFAGNLNTIGLFNTRLTNTQLAELTTVRSGSGGNISYYGPYTIHTFTGSATFTPSFNGEVEVLVVAGGGGGGGAESNFNGGGGGGGGAGGLLYVSSYGVSAGTGITVTIGAGGSGGTIDQNNATNGSNSVFGGLTAIGGGRGGADQGPNVPGVGGSGGGAGGDTFVAGAAGIAGQGNKGGDDLGSSRAAGGGGGAGTAGQNSTDSSGVMDGTAGGDGLSYSITGFSTYYAGGGGGGGSNNFSGTIPNSGLGGLGGGGNSVGLINGTLISNTSGVPNTGGGGGGGANATTAGNGGSGIVIVRYLT